MAFLWITILKESCFLFVERSIAKVLPEHSAVVKPQCSTDPCYVGRAVRAGLLIVLTRRRMEELTTAAGYTLVWYEEVD